VISGTEIAAARHRAGLSQKALADLLGTDVKTVNNWETGRTKPRQLEAVRQFVQMHPPAGAAPLSLISDEELLREIAERFARTRAKGDLGDGNNLDQKSVSDPEGGGEVIEGNFGGPDPADLIGTIPADAPGEPSEGQRLREQQDEDGEQT
jgi:transcriptional regulator with XRE-family HTH domain